MRILGIDPGLRATGWGVVEAGKGRLRHIAHGSIRPPTNRPLDRRLLVIFEGLIDVVREHAPGEAAIEETFVNKNAAATLSLGQARAAGLLAAAQTGLPIAEYAPNRVKKAVVGVGHADKEQVAAMVCRLMPIEISGPDAADALAIAICHSHFRESEGRLVPAAGIGTRGAVR
ncbi:MAG: crossover junction endodeoxyribonuclease RuvC [Pseudomonadota bacterium]